MDNNKRNIGIIDLGSNTFHLLIISVDHDQSWTQEYKERSHVGLAEKGIEIISDEAINRGLIALAHFKHKLKEFGVTDYRAIGTSAIRSASNGSDFVSLVSNEIGLEIEVIDGLEEAALIHRGVASIADTNTGSHVIMDVGGGSVEFILVEEGELKWSQSYNIGVGVLYNLTELSDPISDDNVSRIETYINERLSELIAICRNQKIDSIIGASGSFEVVQSVNGDPMYSDRISAIDLERYHEVSKKIRISTLEERQQMEGLPASRIKLIVVAMILIDRAIEIIKPNRLHVSPYALKEGLISTLLTDKK